MVICFKELGDNGRGMGGGRGMRGGQGVGVYIMLECGAGGDGSDCGSGSVAHIA